MRSDKKSTSQHTKILSKEEYYNAKNILYQNWSKTPIPERPASKDIIPITEIPSNLKTQAISKLKFFHKKL